MNKIYVVAGNQKEYLAYLRDLVSDKRYAYLSSISMLIGLKDIEGVFIGTCYDRSDIEELITEINLIRLMNNKPYITMDSIKHLSNYRASDPPAAYKVSIPNTSVDHMCTVVAKLYKSFRMMEIDDKHDEVYYYFINKQEALEFGKKYDTIAYEYS